MNIGVVLKKLRESRGLTVAELGKKSGTSNGAVGDIERGSVANPRQTTLEKIAKALNLNQKERKELFLSTLSEKLPQLSKIDLFVKGHVTTNDDFVEHVNYLYEEKTLEDDVNKNCFFIKLDSPEAQMPKGGWILIDPLKIKLENLKVYLIEFEGRDYIKRIKKIPKNEDMLILKSLNNKTEDIFVAVDEIKIKGRAVKYNWIELM